MTQKLGYGAWDQLKLEIRKSWQFKFDWFLKSRTPQELNRRVDTLIRLIEKENQEIEEDEKEEKRKNKVTREMHHLANAPSLQQKNKKLKKAEDEKQKTAKSKKREGKPVVTSISKRRKVQPQQQQQQ